MMQQIPCPYCSGTGTVWQTTTPDFSDIRKRYIYHACLDEGRGNLNALQTVLDGHNDQRLVSVHRDDERKEWIAVYDTMEPAK